MPAESQTAIVLCSRPHPCSMAFHVLSSPPVPSCFMRPVSVVSISLMRKGTVNLSGSMAGRYVIHVLASRLRLTGSTSGLSGFKWRHFCNQSNHPMAGREAMSALFAPVCADRVSDRVPKKPLPAATCPGLGSHVIGSPGTARYAQPLLPLDHQSAIASSIPSKLAASRQPAAKLLPHGSHETTRAAGGNGKEDVQVYNKRCM